MYHSLIYKSSHQVRLRQFTSLWPHKWTSSKLIPIVTSTLWSGFILFSYPFNTWSFTSERIDWWLRVPCWWGPLEPCSFRSTRWASFVQKENITKKNIFTPIFRSCYVRLLVCNECNTVSLRNIVDNSTYFRKNKGDWLNYNIYVSMYPKICCQANDSMVR